MKKQIITLGAGAAMLFALGLSSCIGDGGGTPTIKYLPVILDNDNDWGLVDMDGKMVFNDEFSTAPELISNDMFVIGKGGNYTVHNISEHPKEVDGLVDLGSCGAFKNNDLMPVTQKNQRITVVDKKGNVKFTLDPIDGKEISKCAGAFTDGLLIVANEDGKWGAVNTEGKSVIKCKYDEFLPFVNGKAIATLHNDEGEATTSLIDKKGEVVLKLKDSYNVRTFNEYGLLIEVDDRYAFVDDKGELAKLPSKIGYILDFNKKYIIYYYEGDCGVMTREGEVIIRPKYDNIQMIDGGGSFLVTKNDKYKIINAKDDELATLDYEAVFVINPIGKPVLIARDFNEYIMIDAKGNKLSKDAFKNISTGYFRNSVVYSQYVDIEGMANVALQLITADGIDGVTLGNTPNKYMTEIPSSWLGYSFTPDKINKIPSVYGFSTRLEASTDRPITVSEGYYYWSSYVPNPDAKIDGVILNISCDREEATQQVMDKIVENLTSKGFKKVEDKFETDKSVLSLDNNYGSLTIRLCNKTNPAEMAVAEEDVCYF